MRDIVVRIVVLSAVLVAALAAPPIARAQGPTIGFGQTISGTIAPGAVKAYTFAGKAGDVILLAATTVSGDLWPDLALYGPEGELLVTDGRPAHVRITATLPVAGSYRVEVKDGFNGTLTGSYNLHLQRLNGPGGAIVAAFGKLSAGAISAPAEMDAYTFAARAGDVVIAAAARPSGDLWPRIELYGPDGVLVAAEGDVAYAEVLATTPVTGTYTLLVSDEFQGSFTGGYNLYLQRLNDPAGAIALEVGQTVAGAVSPGEMDTYRFTGTAGNTVALRASRTAGTIWPQIRVYGPRGELVGSSFDPVTAELVIPLRDTGAYTLLVNEGFHGALGPSTGEYELTLLQASQSAHFRASLITPDSIRPGRPYVLWVEYTNTGQAPIPAPLLVLSASPGVGLRLSEEQDFREGPLQMLGINHEGTAGTLPPGATNRIPVYCQAPFSVQRADFRLETITDPDAPLDLIAAARRMRPDGWSDSDWAPLRDALIAHFGPTYGTYHNALLAEATRGSDAGLYIHDAQVLFEVIRIQVAASLTGVAPAALLGQQALDGVTFWVVDAMGGSSEDTSGLDPSKPTKIILHGWHNGGDAWRNDPATWANQLADAYNHCHPGEYNVVIVDAGNFMRGWGWPFNYLASAANVDDYGRAVARWLHDNSGRINLSTTHVIGHSFGSHAAGIAGRTLQENYGMQVRRITALDMAKYPREDGLRSTDADKVEVFNGWGSIWSRLAPVGDENWFVRECRPTSGIVGVHAGPIYRAINSIRALGGGPCQEDANPDRRWGLRDEPDELGDKGFLGLQECDGGTTAFGLPSLGMPPGVGGPGLGTVGWGASRVVASFDPNEKLGPVGTGPAAMISPQSDIGYHVYFENQSSATAPAQEVVITDHLDSDLDWSTLQVTEVAWGNRIIALPGSVPYSTKVLVSDHRPGVSASWWVEVKVEFDQATGRLRWSLRTLDPATGAPPTDPLAGFLPPNDGTGRGEGHVAFRVRPRAGLAAGATVANQAVIAFDDNAPITTNRVVNALGETLLVPLVLK